MATIGLVKSHRMLRQEGQRHSGTDPHFQEYKIVQEHQLERKPNCAEAKMKRQHVCSLGIS